MKAIACIDKFGGLGYKGKLLFHIKEDMMRFRELTMGGTVVMGYNTFISLPHGALPGRQNIVLSKNHTVEDSNVIVLDGRESLFRYIEEHQLDADKVWIIGGESLYREFINDCDEVYLTRVDDIRQSDRFMPDPTYFSEWKLANREEHETGGGLSYRFEVFEKRKN